MTKIESSPNREKTESPTPGALGRLLELMGRRIGTQRLDRLWIFPPLVRGRKEWGLVAASCSTDDPELREVITGSFVAELTGQGITFQPELATEGSAPPDRLPRIMDGVVRRSELPLDAAREVELGGDGEAFQALIQEYQTDEDSEAP